MRSRVSNRGGDSAPLSPMTEVAWHVSLLVRGGALRATSVLARRGRDIAIFDTGLAQHAASLVAALAVEGVAPDDVTLVFNTHSHVDHSHNNALFRRARIFCSARDQAWTRALYDTLGRVENPTPEDVLAFYPEMSSALYDAKIVRKVLSIEKFLWDESRWGHPDQFVWLEENAPPAGISIIETPGHAPYHVSYAIQTAGRAVLIAGDALLVRGEAQASLQLVPPYNLSMYQRSQEIINAFAGLVVPGHDEPFDNSAAGLTNDHRP